MLRTSDWLHIFRDRMPAVHRRGALAAALSTPACAHSPAPGQLVESPGGKRGVPPSTGPEADGAGGARKALPCPSLSWHHSAQPSGADMPTEQRAGRGQTPGSHVRTL